MRPERHNNNERAFLMKKRQLYGAIYVSKLIKTAWEIFRVTLYGSNYYGSGVWIKLNINSWTVEHKQLLASSLLSLSASSFCVFVL